MGWLEALSLSGANEGEDGGERSALTRTKRLLQHREIARSPLTCPTARSSKERREEERKKKRKKGRMAEEVCSGLRRIATPLVMSHQQGVPWQSSLSLSLSLDLCLSSLLRARMFLGAPRVKEGPAWLFFPPSRAFFFALHLDQVRSDP